MLDGEVKKNSARGNIASSQFRRNRVPQHIQNQVVRLYCTENNLQYVLSRAEYAISADNMCQIWAALHEGYPHIVAYSIMQLPLDKKQRKEIIIYAINKDIKLHFACEKLIIEDYQSYEEIDCILRIQDAIDLYHDKESDLKELKRILDTTKFSNIC